jgi:hypothetical protein
MVTPEELTLRGLRAYELGRLLTALRVALVVVPVAAVCLIERSGREACACLAFILLSTAVWLRWRNRRGMDAVHTGLLAGSLPLAVGLVFDRLDLRCGLAGAESFCTTFAVLFGTAAGVLISVSQSRLGARASSVLTAGAIAGLAAALSCVRLGALGVTSMLLGIVLGSVAGAAVAKRARRGGPRVGR